MEVCDLGKCDEATNFRPNGRHILEKRKEGQLFVVTLATISEIMNGSSSEKSCLFVGRGDQKTSEGHGLYVRSLLRPGDAVLL